MSSRYRTSYAPPPRMLAKSVTGTNTRELTFTSLLTFPCIDLDGDYVAPEGCDFRKHILDPRIDLEHGNTKLGMRPVAWARKSLSEPGAPHSVYWKRIDFGEPGAPEVHRVPIGVEYYDPSDRVSMQVFALREQDVLPASSLEFSPVNGHFRPIGKALIRPGNAYHFDKVDVHRWTVCERGVNPGALTPLRKSLAGQVPTALSKILRDKRINVGGSMQPLCEVLFKALSAPVAPSTKTVVPLGLKAMPYPTPDDDEDEDAIVANEDDGEGVQEEVLGDDTDTPVEDADLTTPGEDEIAEQAAADDDMAHPSVQATYEAAGAIVDACEHLKTAAKSTESKEIYRDLSKMCAQIEALAAKLKSVGDKHDSALQQMKSGAPTADDTGDEEVPEGDEEPDGDEDGSMPSDDDGDAPGDDDMGDEDEAPKGKKKPPFRAKKALLRDADGAFSNIRPVYQKAMVRDGWRPTRDMLAPEQPAPVKKAPAKPKHDPRAAALESRIDKLTRLLNPS